MKHLAAGPALALALALPAAPQETPPYFAGTALTIDGVDIPVRDYVEWLVRFRGESRAPEYTQLWVLEREAMRLDVVVPPEVVRAETEARLRRRILEVFQGDEARWRREIEAEHRTEEGVKKELDILVRGELTADAILGAERVVGEEALRRGYEHKYGRGGHTIDARVIKVELSIAPAPPGAKSDVLARLRQEAIDNAEKIAKQVVERARGGESFAVLARRYSAHETAAGGGVFPGGFLPGEFSAQVLDELEQVEAGQLSPPIFGMGAWWIFDVQDVRQTPFEAVRAEIEQEILAAPPSHEEYGALRSRLLAGIEWEVLPAMWAEPDADEPLRLEEAVLTIDGIPVRRAEYSLWLLHGLGEVMAPRYVEAWLIRRAAKERGISLDPADLERRIAEDIARMQEESKTVADVDWKTRLEARLTSPEALRRDLLVNNLPVYLAEDMMRAERVVTEGQIRVRWEERYGPGGHTLDARLIRLEVVPKAPARGIGEEERERIRGIYLEKKELADSIVARLRDGEDFAALARQFSDDATRTRGGEFEDGFDASAWPSAVVNGLAELEVGDVSEPLETDTSLCIFEILEARETPLESVREALRLELERERPSSPDLALWRNVLTRDVPWSTGAAMAAD